MRSTGPSSWLVGCSATMNGRRLRGDGPGRPGHAADAGRARLPRRRACASSPRPARPGAGCPGAGARWRSRTPTTADFSGLDIALCSTGATASRAAGPADRRGRGDGDRQHLGVADGPRGAPGGARGERRGALGRSPRASWPTPTARPWWRCRCSSPSTTRPGSPGSWSPPTRRCRGPGWPGWPSSPSSWPRPSTGPRTSPSTGGRSTSRRRSSSPAPVAHNVLPAGRAGGRRRLAARPTRSRSTATRAARSSACPTCAVTCTCVRVPVFTGHSAAIVAEFERRALAPSGPPSCWPAPPGWWCRDVPTPLGPPAGTPPTWAGSGGTTPPGGLALFVVGDNLRKGAALNAVQIAEALLARRRLLSRSLGPGPTYPGSVATAHHRGQSGGPG